MREGFAAAMLRYFGKKPNQTNSQFLQELKELDQADKVWFDANLPANA